MLVLFKRNPLLLSAVVVVTIATNVMADKVIRLNISGTIRSSELNPRIGHRFTFPGHPSDNTLLVFNITKAIRLKSRTLKYYGESVTSGCGAFLRSGNEICADLWLKSYSSCVLNEGSFRSETEAITISKLGRNRQLVVDYKIVYCDSGRIVTSANNPNKERQVSVTTEAEDFATTTDRTSEDKEAASRPIQWALILAVALSSAALTGMVAFAIFCWRKRKLESEKPTKAETTSEGDYMQPQVSYIPPESIYEEIIDFDQPYDELGTDRHRAATEPPIRRFNDTGYCG